MTHTTPASSLRRLRMPGRACRAPLGLAAILLCAALLAGGCGTGHPKVIAAGELAEAKLFPYYRVYWVGPSFENHPLPPAARGERAAAAERPRLGVREASCARLLPRALRADGYASAAHRPVAARAHLPAHGRGGRGRTQPHRVSDLVLVG